MSTQLRRHHSILVLGLIVLAMTPACTGRRITTAVEDQAFLPGPSPAPAVEAAKVIPPPAAMPETAKEAPPPAAMAEPAREVLAPSAKSEQPVTEAPPPKPTVEEIRVAERPVAPAPQPKPAPPPPQPVAELSDIFFDFDQYTIRGDARSGLEGNARFLTSPLDQTILIEGHCDERGTSAYNLVLGERRAQATKRYLQDLGVPPSRLQITSYGKERPFCPEHSEACWQSNRRAHFRRP